ncbi:DNA-binding LacI/PurR family transcriptional regulator [Spinactinospora alkalitolerans]|uniref:DNA-binding LacI/PurR family transcriptional regulator n=1 Tax=Spinactinospora alkalitolerans TaxID=687207 RepID=A0A852U527_9ACTN|nr:LacI family DNA-binding transcriptional regulator [Spinactinospora alkalitolerans]NYE49040.1 DNA-binding LacI/PurR family transcriptional regulator [Spinactinospora alkalitolerans]
MPSPNGRSPVMADVARLAGVSHQTVSRVLNGHPNVRTETQARVQAAIEELGYHRNSSARALVTRRTNVLGVIAFDTTLYGPASTLFGIEQAAREAGYFVSIVSLKTITRRSVREALDYLTEQSVEGFIVIAPQRAAVQALADLVGHRPLVAVEGGRGPGVPVVCVDQVGGARMATEHLLRLGHPTVHHIAGPPEWLEAEGRVQGWRQVLQEAGVPAPEPVYGDWSPRSGYGIGLRLARDRAVSAVFVANDQMAVGVLRAFNESGVRVPEDVSVVGFDDVPEAEFLTPPLTTVWQDFGEVGRRSIRVLLELLENGEGAAPTRHVVPARLIPRMSSAAAPNP